MPQTIQQVRRIYAQFHAALGCSTKAERATAQFLDAALESVRGVVGGV